MLVSLLVGHGCADICAKRIKFFVLREALGNKITSNRQHDRPTNSIINKRERDKELSQIVLVAFDHRLLRR